jgi:antitoxin component YwqK of YwqJK toxin-antitoxin module
MNGECISFFPDGKVQYKTNYNGGKRHGHFRQWNKHGKMVHHLVYLNGIVIDIPYSIAKHLAKL